MANELMKRVEWSDVRRGTCHLADTQLDQVREQATHLTTVFSDPRIHARH